MITSSTNETDGFKSIKTSIPTSINLINFCLSLNLFSGMWKKLINMRMAKKYLQKNIDSENWQSRMEVKFNQRFSSLNKIKI